MGHLKSVFVTALLTATIFSFAQANEDSELWYLMPASFWGERIDHAYYSLNYLEQYEQAEWVAYPLTVAMVYGKTPRRDNFRADPKVSTGSALPGDFRGSGYDRGHMAPAGDMKITPLAMSESFFMSNMSPQVPDFNQGIWQILENTVRDWVRQMGDLFVVSGPLLYDELPEIPGTGIAIPEYYFKILYHDDPYEPQAIAFLMENKGSDLTISEYVYTVNDIERFTGIDFFSLLEDHIEEMVESKVDLDYWPGLK